MQRGNGLFTFLQDTLRSSALDGPGIYDRAKILSTLDALTHDGTGVAQVRRPLLVWIASLSILGQRLGL